MSSTAFTLPPFSHPRSETVDADHPWPGLATFTEEHSQFFFGRDDEARELVRRIERKPLTVLFGQSGLGKSSLLQAGVFPELRATGYCPVYVRLDHAPDAPWLTEQVKTHVYKATAQAGTWTRPGSANTGETLWAFFHHRDDVLQDAQGRHLIPVLIFDQFEELFTVGGAHDNTRDRAKRFLAELADLAENRMPSTFEADLDSGFLSPDDYDLTRSDYRVLLSLREDYLPHLESLKNTMPGVMQNRMRLTRLTGLQALEAVTQPAPGVVPEDVARAIVTFVSGRVDMGSCEVEPALLNLVCQELNHLRVTSGASTINSGLLAGSRDTILVQFYIRALGDQPPAVRKFVEDELLTDSGYRENIAVERAHRLLAAEGVAPSVLELLVSRRLLRFEDRLDVRRVELAHDVLCPVVKSRRDTRREREGRELAEQKRQESENALIKAREQEAAARQAAVRSRLIAIGGVTLGVLASAAATWGYLNQRRARSAETVALSARSDAVAARSAAEQARLDIETLNSYLLSDLADELTLTGQVGLLQEIAQRTVTYYDKLPESLRTRESRLGQARALTLLGNLLGSRGESDGALAQITEAVTLVDGLAQERALSPAEQLIRADVLRSLASRLNSATRFREAIMASQRAQSLLETLRSDPKVGLTAETQLARAISIEAFAHLRTGDLQMAIARYRVSIEGFNASEARESAPKRPGFFAAQSKVWLAEALARTGGTSEAISISQQARDTLRGILQIEPGLISAARSFATVAGQSADIAFASFDFAAAETARRDAIEANAGILARLPNDTTARNNLIVSYNSAARHHFALRNLSLAKANADQGLGQAPLVGATSFIKTNLIYSEGLLAVVLAAQGKEAEAAPHAARMRALAAELASDTRDQTGIATSALDYFAEEATMALENLRFADVRSMVARQRDLLATSKQPKEAQQALNANLQRIAAEAAYAEGNGPAAVAAIDDYELTKVSYDDNAPQTRLESAGDRLLRARILGMVQRRDEARALLAHAVPEIEALVALAKNEPMLQLALASARATQAEVDDTADPALRRAWLREAIALYRRHDLDGRLVRLEKEFYLPRAERLAASLERR